MKEDQNAGPLRLTEAEQLKAELLSLMTSLMAEHLALAPEEAVIKASEASRNIENQVEEKREALKIQLMQLMTAALSEAYPRFKETAFKPVLDKIEARVLSSFETQSLASRRRQNFKIDYVSLERALLTQFIYSVPGAAGPERVAPKIRDLMVDYMNGVLEDANLGSYPNLTRIIHAFDVAFAVYTGLSKVGLKEVGEEAFERTLLSFRGGLALRERNRSEDVLRTQINRTLEDAVPDLNDYQRHSVGDQLLWLFNDFTGAPEEERDDVYSRGEQRILISAFDPTHHQGKPAAAG